MRVLGTPVEAIIATEDREIFNAKLTEINERIAEGYPASTVDDAVAMAAKIGFPVIMRAAFALGGPLLRLFAPPLDRSPDRLRASP